MANSVASPRTLTQMLREWDDETLARLLWARPDLAFPAPESYSQVASRATTRHSVATALDNLNAIELWVAQQIAVRGESTRTSDVIEELAEHPDVDAPTVAAAVERLLSLALLWGNSTQVRPVRAMAGLVGGDAPDDAVVVDVAATPPNPASKDTPTPGLADKVGAGSAFEFVRRMDVLIEHCDHRPPRLVRAGGLSQRDIRLLADLLDLTPAVTRHHLEIAQAAGLLGPAPRDLTEVLMPTTAFDTWQGRTLAAQWVELVRAWTLRHANSGSAALKSLILSAFGSPSQGITITSATLRPWLAWQRPRRPHGTDRQAGVFLDLANWIGVTGMGALTSYVGSDLTAIDPAGLDRLLPTRVDHVLVQADLTAIAPGPLTPEAARDLGSLADVESRGGATVYRFSPESLTRARGLGWTSNDMVTTLTERSRTPLPQALEYLIRDLDRLRPPGSALIPDPITLSTGHQHRPPARATPVIDDMEMSPVDRIDAEHIANCLELLRADNDGTRAPSSTSTEPTDDSATRTSSMMAPIEDLREAAETGEVVWFGYVDPRGASSERLVRALSVDDGVLIAEDTSTGEQISVALHRITSAHIIRTSS